MIPDIFTTARSAKVYTTEPVSNAQLHQLYEWVKWSPSESNSWPLRLTFVRSDEQRQRLQKHVVPGNQSKVESAPVTAIVAYDTAFTDHLPQLAPHLTAPTYFDNMSPDARAWSAQRSANLQAGMLIAAARAMGLDCGPLGGFDRDGIDQDFYADSSWRSSFLLMLGKADAEQHYPRGPRLAFEQACQII